MLRRKAAIATFLAAVSVTAGTAVAVPGDATVASAATATFTPVADTYVDNSVTTTNYGTSAQLGVDNSPVKRMFLKFTVSGVTGTVTGAKLRVHTDDVSGAESPSGGSYKAMSNTTWSETGVTWASQPAIDG